DAAAVESLQRALNALGCNAGTIDGKLGPNTTQAIRWFQTAAGIAVDGVVGIVTTGKLVQAASTGSPNCPTGPAPAPPGPVSGGPCTQALIQAAAQNSLFVNERIVKPGPYQCVGNFTYNAPTVATGGGRQTQVINLMRWNGTTWLTVNRALYCESGDVPAAI